VINALFETSGLRCDGDCARLMAQAIEQRAETSTRGVFKRMRRSVIAAAETQNANASVRFLAPLARHVYRTRHTCNRLAHLGATCFLPYDLPLPAELGNFGRPSIDMSCLRHCGIATVAQKQIKERNDASSFAVFELPQQLLFQMSPRCLFDCASLRGYALLLRLTLSAGSRFHGLRHVPDLRSKCADVSLFWFRVGIHEKFTAACWRKR
jgi:hypothetical protein